MDTQRVLIVDDQQEVRQVLRSAIESLNAKVEVFDVPSGEEALLELSAQEFDLLISDVRLPGISGLELIDKLRQRNPDMKVVLVTGVMDTKVRQQVADAGAVDFFLKPIETGEFLDAVERHLGLVESDALEVERLELDQETTNVSNRLAKLRRDLEAISAVLLDERGRVLARAGNLPNASVESAVFPALMAAFSASERISALLGSSPPTDLMHFSGPKYALFLAHVGESYGLLIATNPITTTEQIQAATQIVHLGLRDLRTTLTKMGVPLTSEGGTVTSPPEMEDTEEAVESPLIEALFQEEGSVEINPKEVDDFWDTASQSPSKEEIISADALTYDQARQLGLTPPDDDEEE